MNNTLYTLGLRVENYSPSMFETQVELNSQISLEFNSDLDVGTILTNIFILKDDKFSFDATSQKVDIDKYGKVEGSVVYKDKTVIFSPKISLDVNCRYIVYIPKGSITDVLGNTLLMPFISYFSTESTILAFKCNVVEPINNAIINSLEKVVLDDVNNEKYLLQISKNKTFENVVYDNIEDNFIIEKDFNLGDGLYYIRAKSLNGVFGDTNVFSIKSCKSSPTTDQDIDDNSVYFDEEEIVDGAYEEFSFPEDNSNFISEKSNVIYKKFKGKIELSDIDFYESYLVGMYNDDDSDDDIEHEVDGAFSVIYDDVANESYIAFIPNSL